MTHRGAIGADGKTGDGCGLLLDIDKDFFKKTLKEEQNIELIENYAIGQLFLSSKIEKILPQIKKILNKQKLKLIAYRKVPVNKKILGEIALDCLPNIYQLFVRSNEKIFYENQFDTSLYQSRKFIEEIYQDDEEL